MSFNNIDISKIFSKDCLNGDICDIQKLLDAKEDRKNLQDQFIKKYSSTLVSVTLVTPGGIKKNYAYETLFCIIKEVLEEVFVKNEINVNESFSQFDQSGALLLYSLDANALDVKVLLTNLEETHYLGRFWDLDVINSDFKILSRKDFGLPARKCFLCSEDAKVCARQQKHDYHELANKIHESLKEYLFQKLISELAYNALLREVKLTPKPGLVDLNNNGSHKDMNVELFLKSAKVLKPFFEKFISIGMSSFNDDISILFSELRISGIEAEREMFSETGQVNTHKGAIFSFALVLGVIGRLSKKENYNFTIFDLLDNVKICASNISNELSTKLVSNKRKEMYEKYNLKGARGEAESGYETLRKYIIPIFKEYEKYDEQHRFLIFLLRLMSVTNDTNLVNRGDIGALKYVQEKAFNAFLDKKNMTNKEALIFFMLDFDKDLINKNLSPGGSADLLAISCFLFDYFSTSNIYNH